ncbi:phosphatidylinositol-specific phospholipase C domain-containing protein [Rhodococcus sp. NPDC127528]|uniref:phosphatidylinositol-specific phospholipase C domain-containing protein n=1 Tax=unclassified Rhodococcus (in: high G+C Gram-positive bacteria) TaxID=192944 RepID=UPI003641CDA1
MNRSRPVGRAAAAAVLTGLVFAVSPSAVHADAGRVTAGDDGFASTTSVGLHNTYERAKYDRLTDALDAGSSLIEIDVWTNVAGPGWRVSHSNPVGSDSNCSNGSMSMQLTGDPDQGLGDCLSDLRVWHDANPGHRPITVKLELKDGFTAGFARGPADLDLLLRNRLGDALFRPAALVGDSGRTLDDAVRADGWPTREAMAGTFMIELIPGTVEESNPLDDLWSDREYALHLRQLAAAGQLDRAAAFPAVHRAQAGDPRARYEQPLRPWFVVFDGDAAAYADGGIDTGWYRDNHYLLVMTDAHSVAPPIASVAPTEAQARARVAELAARSASIVTSDWTAVPTVLSEVVPRG